jgi:DNA repair ATPase RecN
MSDKLCYKLLNIYKKFLIQLENAKIDLETNENIIIEYEEDINFLYANAKLKKVEKDSDKYKAIMMEIINIDKNLKEEQEIRISIINAIENFEKEYKKAYDEYIKNCKYFRDKRLFNIRRK